MSSLSKTLLLLALVIACMSTMSNPYLLNPEKHALITNKLENGEVFAVH